MKTFFILIAICVSILFLWDAPGDMFRKEVIKGYGEHCLETQAQPGREKEVRALCGCQAEAVEETFSAFDFLKAVVNKQLGKPVLTENEMKELEEKVRACFRKAVPGLTLGGRNVSPHTFRLVAARGRAGMICTSGILSRAGKKSSVFYAEKNHRAF